MKKVITLLVIIFISCSEPQNSLLPQISNTSDTYSIDDFVDLGFKIGEKYDNVDLPKSESVYWGFWKDKDADEGSARFQSLGGSVGGMRDFEIRFYENHSYAVEYGKIYAEDSSGKNAVLTKKRHFGQQELKTEELLVDPMGHRYLNMEDMPSMEIL